MTNHSPSARRSAKARAFSLVELVVTVGITATVLLPLVALMALATSSQRESNEESIAMMISQGVYADLRKSSEGASGGNKIFLRHSSNYPELSSDPNLDYHKISSTTFTYDIVYGMDPDWAAASDGVEIDRGAKPLRPGSGVDYSAGTGAGDATNGVLSTHIVRIEASQAPSVGGRYDPDLKLVRVLVEVPAVAGQGDRRVYEFSSFMTLTDRFVPSP